MARKDDIERLVAINNRRLRILKEQQATYGLNTPPHIVIEIEDLEAEIAKLTTELESLGQGKGETHQQGSQSRAAQVMRDSLNALLNDLLEDYRAVNGQIGGTLDEADRRRLERRRDDLEKEIRSTQDKLNAL